MNTNEKIIEIFIINSLIKINKRYKELELSQNLFNQGIDSLDFFKLIFILEQKFKLKVNQKDYNKLNTLKKIKKYVLKKKI
jgi:acyl carrier protein